MGLEPWANQHDYRLIYDDVEQGFNPGLEWASNPGRINMITALFEMMSNRVSTLGLERACFYPGPILFPFRYAPAIFMSLSILHPGKTTGAYLSLHNT